MGITFYCGSGSPYAWRVWLALEHKQLPYALKILSFSSGDLKTPEFITLNPRGKVPVVTDNGFALYESAAIVEYLEDRYPNSGSGLFPLDIAQRARARRLVREGDQYLATAMEKLVEEILFKPREQWDSRAIDAGKTELVAEFNRFEAYAPRDGFLVGAASAADFTVYPLIALALRIEDKKKPDLGIRSALGPNLSAWFARVEKLPYFAKTIPPHWQER